MSRRSWIRTAKPRSWRGGEGRRDGQRETQKDAQHPEQEPEHFDLLASAWQLDHRVAVSAALLGGVMRAWEGRHWMGGALGGGSWQSLPTD